MIAPPARFTRLFAGPSNFVGGERQAAWVCLTPFTNTTPAITSWIRGDPFNALYVLDALSIKLKTIVKQYVRMPLPFVFECRNRTVENTDSIG
jgi:hypothetical protein